MIRRKRELAEVISEIRKYIPGFNKKELLEYVDWSIKKLYDSLKNEKEIKIKCRQELIDKLNKDRDKYRIDKNMDHLSVQYVEIFDTIKNDDELYIQLYTSIYFYDNASNNASDKALKDGYWNDIWIVTIGKNIESDKISSNCANCGAIMKYDDIRNMFKCEYCGNTINNNNYKWTIIDIELGN